jgi:DNA mismatch endonuclease (patch repair protein)
LRKDAAMPRTRNPEGGTPAPSSESVSQRMKRQPQHDTAAELAVRRQLWALGLRYRVHYRATGGRRRVDVAFTRARVAVFVDGCFWHSCPLHGTRPKANDEWWKAKLERNVERDRSADAELRAAGWTVVRIWEHEDPVTAAHRVAGIVARARGAGRGA